MTTSTAFQDPATVNDPHWLGVLSIALGAFALVVMEFLPVGLLPGIIQGLSISEGTAGLTVTATAALGFIAAPATALLVGTIDRRRVMLGLTTLVVISGVMSSFALNLTVLLVARIILGVGVGGFWAISIIAAARLVPEDQVHKASSLVFAGISVATVVAVPLGSFIATHYDWRVAFMVATGLAVAVLLLQIFTLPSITVRSGATVRDFIGLLKSPKVVAIYLAIIFMVSGQFCGYTFVTPYLQQVSAFSVNNVSIVLFAYGTLAIAGNFIGGALAGRDLHKTVYGNFILFFLAFIAIAAFPHNSVIAVVSLLAWALSWGMAPVGTQLWLFNSTQDAPEAAQATNTSVFQLSITLGSLVGGVLVDHVDLRSSMWGGAIILALAVIMVLIVGRMDTAESKG